jgi:2-amino-4-hydroxy-6-hydroxymethyldihydropteridine diphosphokinase
MGVEDQPWFVNGVAWVRSALTPRDVMARLHRIENDMGRVRLVPGGPRVIDLDLLLYGMQIVSDETLRIPHPRLHQRRFVLEPLWEIAPHVIHPVSGKSVGALLGELDDVKVVRRLEEWEVLSC